MFYKLKKKLKKKLKRLFKKKFLWWKKTTKYCIKYSRSHSFYYNTASAFLVSRKPIKKGYKRRRRLLILRKFKLFRTYHIKLLLVRFLNKFKILKYSSQDIARNILYKKLQVLMSIICRKADFLEEYNLENKKDKKKLRKDSDIFLKKFVLPEMGTSDKFNLQSYSYLVNLGILNILKKKSLSKKIQIIQHNYAFKSSVDEVSKRRITNVYKGLFYPNQKKFYPYKLLTERSIVDPTVLKKRTSKYLRTTKKLENINFFEKKIIIDTFTSQWTFFTKLYLSNTSIFSKLCSNWDTACKIFLPYKRRKFKILPQTYKSYQKQFKVSSEFSLEHLKLIHKKKTFKSYIHKQRLKYISFSQESFILAFCKHKSHILAYHNHMLTKRISTHQNYIQKVAKTYSDILGNIQKISIVKNQKLRNIKTRYFRKKKFIPVFKKKSFDEWSKLSLDTKNQQLDKQVYIERKLISRRFSNVYKTILYLKKLNLTKHKKTINRIHFTNLVIKKIKSPFLLFSNSFLTKYYYKRYIINFYNNTKNYDSNKRRRKQKKKIYAFNFWKKKLKVYKNARQVHWNIYTKKTLKSRRYQNFLKPFLKKNTSIQDLIIKYLSVKFNFSATFWQTFTELYFKFFHKTIAVKHIYQFPISLVFWYYLKKNQSNKNKIKIKIKHWLSKSRWIRKKFWMNTRRNLPKFFFQQTFFDKTMLGAVQFDFKTSSLCILKNSNRIINRNSIIWDNKMLKLHSMRYKS